MIKNFSLKDYNTFGLDVKASQYFSYDNNQDIINFIDNNSIFSEKYLVLGEGSNILFTGDFDGLIIHSKSKGITKVYEDRDFIEVKVSAGEIWDDFVEWAVENSYYGIENLSLIPGTVAASAVQNIGAYGVEVSELITKVRYIDLADGEVMEKNNFQCKFGYRDSIFKHRLKSRAIILSVNFRLKKKAELNTCYFDVSKEIMKYENPGLHEMREAIINIRNSKLPDPKKLGNAGSFFKNPLIDKLTLDRLVNDFPKVKYHVEVPGISFKISAGWLIDNLGFKGFEHKGAAVDENHALVLVNKNNAKGSDIFELSKMIQEKVFITYGVMLEPEVQII